MTNDYEQKARDNTSKIEEGIKKLQEYSSEHKPKDFWDYNKEVIEMFKTFKPLSKENREKLWMEYRGIIDVARKEQAQYKKETSENASKIEKELERLQTDHLDPNDSPILFFPMKRIFYKEFWEHSNQIREMFKSLNLPKEYREKLWSNYENIRNKAKDKQNGDVNRSTEDRKTLEILVQDIDSHIGMSVDKTGLYESKNMYSKALKKIKEKRLLKSDREHILEHLRELNKKIGYKRGEIQESNYFEVKGDTDRCFNNAHRSEDPYQVLEEIKEVQITLSGAYINREQRQELRKTLDDAWKKAGERIGEVKGEKRRRYEEVKERMENNVERWGKRIEDSEGFISRLEEQISELEDEVTNAKTDEYAERVKGWIEGKYQKIEEVREQIKELEGKMEDIKSKLKS